MKFLPADKKKLQILSTSLPGCIIGLAGLLILSSNNNSKTGYRIVISMLIVIVSIYTGAVFGKFRKNKLTK